MRFTINASGITTSDSYNTVDAYKQYVQKELESQKMVALNSNYFLAHPNNTAIESEI